jgi:hypothetical protein
MIDLRIGLNEYKLPLDWRDITLYDATQLHSVCLKSIPTKLKEKYAVILSSIDEDDCNARIKEWSEDLDDSYVDELLVFVSKVYEHFKVDVSQTTDESKLEIYVTYLELFVIGILHNGAGYEQIGFEEFEHNNKFYELPEHKVIAEDLIPMYDLLTIQFTECADILSYIPSQGFKLMPFFISTLVMEGFYDEDTVLDNAKEFQSLPMDIVWECVNEFQNFHNYCYNRFTNLFKPSKGGGKAKLSNSWRNLIIDKHLSSRIPVDEIENSRILDTMEVSDRESEVTEYQNKIQEEATKKAKK